ncbi:MAG: NAD(P)-dependent oxidoreductase [Clostridiales bacterium]|nr:NAD(P)-dependent oxidoreductase [Clostridiales bacterium]
MKIAMTGASGNMGREALKQTLEIGDVEFVRVLLTDKKKNDKLSKSLKKIYGERIEIVRGTIANADNCNRLVSGVDYVVHMAAVIPPASDANPAASEECNYKGAIVLVDAIKRCSPQPKYIHVSTMALYGNRNEKHLWGRVGDPLLVSPFDHYAMHKLKGERYAIEAGLDCWVVLRQTAMVHPNMMQDNIKDGLMFHTALNAPLEWVTSRDSGYLIKRILERDSKGEVPQFWKNVYNIGAGKMGMDTGYDTFKDGFGIIGGSPEKFFKPHWFATRNFHGLWFADGHELNDLFEFQRDGVSEYWKEIGKNHKLYSLGKLVPAKLIYLFLFKKLLYHPNSPYKWLVSGDKARTMASFGRDVIVPTSWEDTKLIAKGDFGDYDELRDVTRLTKDDLLNHGYDEKPIDKWNIDDYRQAAAFRGGSLVSQNVGSPYDKAVWRCADGHQFEATPFSVLRGGHWCPECSQPTPWDFDRLAKSNPFFAQVWYDSHAKDEDVVYDFNEDGSSKMTKIEEKQR